MRKGVCCFSYFLLLFLQTERLVACRLNILPGQAMLIKGDADITCSDCTFMYPSGQEPMESIWKGEAFVFGKKPNKI